MNKRTKFSLQVLTLGSIALAGFQNCAPGTLSSKSSSMATDSASTFSECANGLCEVVDLKTVAVVNSENALTSMLHLTGVQTPSNATRNAYMTQGTKITDTGKTSAVTAPMWVAITTLGSEVCNDALMQEKALAAADRRFYNSVDFTQGFGALTTAAKEDMIRRFARSFWARNESAQEKILIRSTLDDAFAGATSTADTENAAFFVCTAMIASLKAQTY